MKYVQPLWQLTIPTVTELVLAAWNFPFEKFQPNDLALLKEITKNLIDLPSHVALKIAENMYVQSRGKLSFGHILWILESKCNHIKKYWLKGFNLKVLCDFVSQEGKDTVTELIVYYNDDVSDIEYAKNFRNLTKIEFSRNNEVTNQQLEKISANCHFIRKLILHQCNSISHHFWYPLCKNRFIQENLRIVDISGASGLTASTVYFLLPQLTLFMYDNVSSFLRYRFLTCTNSHMPCKQTMHTIRLGDNGIGLGDMGNLASCGINRFKFVTDGRVKKEMELNLPNSIIPPIDNEGCQNIFVFNPDQDETYLFQDVFIAITSVPSHVVFGVPSHEAYLLEMSLTSVKNIDLTLLLKHFSHLEKISLYRDCSVTGYFEPPENSVRSVVLWSAPSRLIKSFLPCFPNLEHLCVGRMKLSYDAFKDLKFDNLISVQIVRCDGDPNINDLFPDH